MSLDGLEYYFEFVQNNKHLFVGYKYNDVSKHNSNYLFLSYIKLFWAQVTKIKELLKEEPLLGDMFQKVIKDILGIR
jgi:hypothetical protein